jgi:hypothetical protein
MKTIKQFLILYLALATIGLNSCKKKSSDNPTPALSAITASVDGATASFNTNAKAVKAVSTPNLPASTTIQGSSSVSGSINVIIYSSSVAVGTYIANNNLLQAGLILTTADGKLYFADNSSTANPLTITVSAVSSTAIKGTFKGDVVTYSPDGAVTGKKVITNGQFDVKF